MYKFILLLCTLAYFCDNYGSATTLLNRTFKNEYSKRWPKGVVPYRLKPPISPKEEALFLEVVNEIHSETCVRFRVKREGDKNWLDVRTKDHPERVCGETHLGMKGGKQCLYLDLKYCLTKADYMRGVLYALGMVPENNRNDRDQYVKVLWENILFSNIPSPNFNDLFYTINQTYPDYDQQTFQYPYDFKSATHYTPFFCTKYEFKSYPTLVPKNYSIVGDGLLDPPTKLSHTDVRNLLRMYPCPADLECNPNFV